VQTIETGECPFGRVGHGIGDDIAHGDNKGTVNQEQTNARWIGHLESASQERRRQLCGHQPIASRIKAVFVP